MPEQKQHVNYADDAGLTSSNVKLSYNADGIIDEDFSHPRTAIEFAAERLGKPPHIQSFPTGTIEFLPGGTKEDCCGAVQATVTALQRRMSTHPPKILVRIRIRFIIDDFIGDF